MQKRRLVLFIGALALILILYAVPAGVHYCDDSYITQQDRENCWWRYWNNQPSLQDLQYQSAESSESGTVDSLSSENAGQDREGGGHYCDDSYTTQQDRENCWWRYWNNQPSSQDLQYQSAESLESGQPVDPPASGTVVNRPTGANVVTISFGTETVTINQNEHAAKIRHRSRDEVEANSAWLTNLDEEVDEDNMVVIDYPENPSDEVEAENHRKAEEEVYNQGKPYVVCFPARTVVTHRTADGVETVTAIPEECIVVTPK